MPLLGYGSYFALKSSQSAPYLIAFCCWVREPTLLTGGLEGQMYRCMAFLIINFHNSIPPSFYTSIPLFCRFPALSTFQLLNLLPWACCCRARMPDLLLTVSLSPQSFSTSKLLNFLSPFTNKQTAVRFSLQTKYSPRLS